MEEGDREDHSHARENIVRSIPCVRSFSFRLFYAFTQDVCHHCSVWRSSFCLHFTRPTIGISKAGGSCSADTRGHGEEGAGTECHFFQESFARCAGHDRKLEVHPQCHSGEEGGEYHVVPSGTEWSSWICSPGSRDQCSRCAGQNGGRKTSHRQKRIVWIPLLHSLWTGACGYAGNNRDRGVKCTAVDSCINVFSKKLLSLSSRYLEEILACPIRFCALLVPLSVRMPFFPSS